MSKYYLTYITNTGAINKKGFMSGDDSVDIQNTDTETAMEISEDKYNRVNAEEEYILNGDFVRRSESPITQTGPLSFANIPYEVPSGVYMTLDTDRYLITESTVDLEITLPGVYKILFEAFPYKNKEFTVEIT